MATKQYTILSLAELSELEAWIENSKAIVPERILHFIFTILHFYRGLADTKSKYTHMVRQLREQMGIISKKEGLSKFDLESASKDAIKKKISSTSDRIKAAKEQLQEYRKALKSRNQEGKKSQNSKSKSRHSMIGLPNEKTTKAGTALRKASEESLRVDRTENFENPIGLHAATRTAAREEIEVSVTKVTYHIETVTDPRTGKSVTASTKEIGPDGYQVTWNSISQICILSIVYAIPANRLSQMLSCHGEETFSSTRILNYIKYASDLLAPIYQHFGESLAELSRLMGDDTNTRVTDMEKIAKTGKYLEKPDPDSLVGKLANIFGRVSKKKKGKGFKKKLNISLIAGRSDSVDRRSYLFFFRTHFGSVGNLLTKLLEMRSPKRKYLTFLGDLSSANLPDSSLLKKFCLTIAGCMAHCRRPFWRYRNQDKQLCYYMARAHLVLAKIEDRLDELEANWDLVLSYRQKYSRRVCLSMLATAKRVLNGEPGVVGAKVWPPGSKLYEACEYLVNHYEELTQFLKDPHLPVTNNLMERSLRPEKMYLVSSKFCKSEEGRVAIDILRSITTTARAAEVDLKSYLTWAMIHHEELAKNPAAYTPFAYAKILDAKK